MGICKSIAWSFTRHKSLKGCPRAHWFQYYRGGEPEEREMLAYSRLCTRPMFMGQIADLVVGMALRHARKDGHVPDLAKVEEVAREYTLKNLVASEKNAETVRQGKPPPFGAQVLDDHAMQEEPTMSDEVVAERVVASAVGFVGSQVFTELAARPITAWPAPRKPSDPRPDAWNLGHMFVASAPDSWIEEPDRFTILDWKASARDSEENALQVAVYGLWAIHEKSADPERVYAQVVLMPTEPEFAPRRVTKLERDAARAQIERDWDDERRVAEGRVIKNGQPILVADRSVFSATPSRQVCGQCKFRKLCVDASI